MKRGKLLPKGFKKTFQKLRLKFLELRYLPHIEIRLVHDNTYNKVAWYKSWSDKSYSSAVHRAVLVAFVVSFGFFSVFQTVIPYWGKPQKALADSHTASWTTKGDFESNASTVGSGTTRSQVAVGGSVAGDDTTVTLGSTNSAASWSATSTGANLPSARYSHSSIWTGSKMIVWGGSNVPYNDDSSGGIYDPVANTWTATSTGTGVPGPRTDHTAIWTGSKMVIWGGFSYGAATNTGGIYDPVANTWVATSTAAGVPVARYGHKAVWTGTHMIVWSGYSTSYTNTGGIWTPNGGTIPGGSACAVVGGCWIATSTGTNVPTGRMAFQYFWTGSGVLVWGGQNMGTATNTGAILTPYGNQDRTGVTCGTAGGCWLPTSTGANVPNNSGPSGVWTGTELIIWGGSLTGRTNTGARYNPVSDSWNPTATTTGVPSGRAGHSAVWSGTKMIIWGGQTDTGRTNTGGLYDPGANTWVATTTGTGVPTARLYHTAEWTGTKMIVWGGILSDNTNKQNTGSRFTPASTVYYASGTVTNLKINAGTDVRANWSTISWNGTKPSNTNIKFRTRSAATEAGLTSATWIGSDGTSGTYYEVSGGSITSSASQWLELELTLTSSDGVSTPTLDDFTIAYNTINSPTNLKTFRTDDGITEINAVGGSEWTNASSVVIKGDVEAINSTEVTPQIAMAEGATAPTVSDDIDVLPVGVTSDKNTTDYADALIEQANLMTLSGLANNKQYTYKLRYLDNQGRSSAWSDSKTFKVDLVGPAEGSIEINGGGSKTNQRAVIVSMDIADTETAVTQMRFSNDDATWSEWETYQTERGWILSAGDGLKTVYVQGKDEVGNISETSFTDTVTLEATSPGVTFDPGNKYPATSWNVKEGANSIEFSFSSDKNSVAYVDYGINAPTLEARGTTEYSTDHSVTLQNLTSSTAYKYRIRLFDELGNTAIYPLEGYYTAQTTANSGLSFDPSNKYPTIDWNVRENVNSLEFNFTADKDVIANVDYGVDTSALEAHGVTEYAKTHSILLKNLSAATTYKYKIRLVDQLGNVAVYPADGTYEATTAENNIGFEGDPLASNLSQVEITASVAKITWKTKVPTTSWVDYGTDSSYGNTAGDDNLTTSHVVELKNLIAGQTYMYRVRGLDSGENEFVSSEFSFKAIMKPEISNVTVENIDAYSAEITWTTNVKTDSDVAYGETTSYSNRAKDVGFLTVHSVKLENLVDDVTYHYQVEARDEYGNATKSQDYSFKTPLDTEGPIIENVRIDVLPMETEGTTAQVIISWRTDKPSTAMIEYGEGLVGGSYEKSTFEDDSLNFSHTSIIKELNPASSYHFRIISKDKRANKTESHDYNVVTPEQNKSIWQLIVRSLEETFSWVSNMGEFFRGIGEKF